MSIEGQIPHQLYCPKPSFFSNQFSMVPISWLYNLYIIYIYIGAVHNDVGLGKAKSVVLFDWIGLWNVRLRVRVSQQLDGRVRH